MNKPGSYCLLNQQMKECAQAEDSLVLIEDGVYQMKEYETNPPAWKDCFQNVYCLESDLLARGLPLPDSAGIAIDYARFVELTAEHQKVLSWY